MVFVSPLDFFLGIEPSRATNLATFASPSAHISFTAHDDRPILVLEDIDHLFDSVVCASSSDGHAMVLIFGDEEAYTEAKQVWSELQAFTVVTAHPSCNSHDQRGAWL